MMIDSLKSRKTSSILCQAITFSRKPIVYATVAADPPTSSISIPLTIQFRPVTFTRNAPTIKRLEIVAIMDNIKMFVRLKT